MTCNAPLTTIESTTTTIEDLRDILNLLTDTVETEAIHVANHPNGDLAVAFARRAVDQFVPILNHIIRELAAQAETLRDVENSLLRRMA